MTQVHVVIHNPYYSPSSLSTAVCWATVKKWSLTMAWSQYRVVFMSTCHEMCIRVCTRLGSWGVYSSKWRFISALSSKSESLLCVPILRCSRVTEHSTEAFWSSQVCTSPVTLAEWQKGANGCCYARLPEHLLQVTLLFHCHLAPSDSTGNSALLFQFLPPTLHRIDAIFCHELINNLCRGRCELLHSNQSQLEPWDCWAAELL